MLLAISLVTTDLKVKIKDNYHLDAHLLDMLQKLNNGVPTSHYLLKDGLLRKKGKLVIGPLLTLRKLIID